MIEKIEGKESLVGKVIGKSGFSLSLKAESLRERLKESAICHSTE
jgi:hypothetical protein